MATKINVRSPFYLKVSQTNIATATLNLYIYTGTFVANASVANHKYTITKDVLNTQLAVINKVIQVLRIGTLYTSKYQLDGDPSCEPFYDRFENSVAGWATTFDVLIENDINVCS